MDCHRLIEEHFPTFLEITYQEPVSILSSKWTEVTTDVDWWVIIAWMILCLWLPNSGFLPVNKNWSLITTIITALVPVWYICANFKKVQTGILAIATIYLRDFNRYQGTNWKVQEGTLGAMPVAFTAVMMLLWLAIWWLSRLTKKQIGLVLFPLLALFVEFLVGKSPVGMGMFYMFVAA